MANAYKCDNCGVFYESFIHTVKTPKYRIKIEIKHRDRQYSPDLCPQCLSKETEALYSYYANIGNNTKIQEIE